MAKEPKAVQSEGSLGVPSESPRQLSGEASVLSGSQASVEGYTGRYLVLLDPDEQKAAEKSLADTAGIKAMSLAPGDDTPIGTTSIGENEALIIGSLGVAVINAMPDQMGSLSTAVAESSAMMDMELERFVYTSVELDVAYLRGFRDAVNHLYDKLTTEELTGAEAYISATFNEAQLSWGLQATAVDRSPMSGRGIRVAVLDTGIDLTHPDFQGRVAMHKSFVEGETVQDGNGHGTHCAGIVGGPLRPRSLPRFGIAPDCDLLIGKVLKDSGRGTDASILAGIDWAISERAAVISMSLGAPVNSETSYSPIFQQVAERAIRAGTLILGAAGNDSKRHKGELRPVSHPANCPAIMAVSALDRELRVGWFSNAGLNANGGKVDIAAPGVDIVSAYPIPTQYKRLDGTSMATPHVAGVAALYAERFAALRGDSLWARLVQQASPLSAPARDVGAGLVQAPQ